MSQKYGSILIVDDDLSALKLASFLLDKYGYSTFTSNISENALEILQKNIIDVVLTDIVMPGISGMDLLERIRNFDSEIPVILVTAYADIDKAIEAIKKGAFDFITKPYEPPRLINSIKRAIEYRRIMQIEKDYRHTLEALNQELETLISERAMNLMALTVADRVRNPATVIGWTCKQMIESKDIPHKLRESFNLILDETKKLETIVQDFHKLLKSRESMFKFEDVNSAVEGVVSIIKKETAYKGVELVINLSESPLKMNMEKNLLKIAILNVTRNAIEATPEGGKITVTTFGEEDNVVFEISDSGYGIPENDVDKIFEPFFSTKKHRFGMGLCLVKQIVSEHMGEIKIKSEVGKGTTIKIIFPVRWMEKLPDINPVRKLG